MTTFEKKVKEICAEVYSFEFSQIVIDLAQGIEEELVETDEEITRDMVGAAAYDTDIIRDINKHDKEVAYLTRLYNALQDWITDIEQINLTLGLPKEN